MPTFLCSSSSNETAELGLEYTLYRRQMTSASPQGKHRQRRTASWHEADISLIPTAATPFRILCSLDFDFPCFGFRMRSTLDGRSAVHLIPVVSSFLIIAAVFQVVCVSVVIEFATNATGVACHLFDSKRSRSSLLRACRIGLGGIQCLRVPVLPFRCYETRRS